MTTTTDAGAELARYMKATEQTGGDPEEYCRLMDVMTALPCRSSTDLLAVVTWASVFLPCIATMLPADDEDRGGPQALLSVTMNLLHRAKEGLEAQTGVAAEAFIGAQGPTN